MTWIPLRTHIPSLVYVIIALICFPVHNLQDYRVFTCSYGTLTGQILAWKIALSHLFRHL